MTSQRFDATGSERHEMYVYPDLGAVGAAADLQSIVGALLMFVLIVAVLMMIICGVTWALAAANGHFEVAARARMGLWVACGGSALAGVGVAWLDLLLDVGSNL